MGWRKGGPNRSGGVVLKLNVGEVITVLPHGEWGASFALEAMQLTAAAGANV